MLLLLLLLFCLCMQVSVSAIGSTRLDFQQWGLQAVVRASVTYYNSERDIDALVSALHQLVQQQQHKQQQQQQQ
jgi:selenocysteine lyase/cysteine desulfurase